MRRTLFSRPFVFIAWLPLRVRGRSALTVLSLLCSLSTPVIDKLSYLTVDLGPVAVLNLRDFSTRVYVGLYGYCVTTNDYDDFCSPARFGFDLAKVYSSLAWFADLPSSVIKGLTYPVAILTPLATLAAFVAFLAIAATPGGRTGASLCSQSFQQPCSRSLR